MKRLNPKTGLPFVHGNTREDGFIFGSYHYTRKNKKGFFAERWYSPEKYKNQAVLQKNTYSNKRNTFEGYIAYRCSSIKSRSKKLNISFNLTPEYLISIFPKECPVFHKPLTWDERNGIQPFTPSLDRIDPNLGYVTNNVRWLSNLANAMKQNATPAELVQFAEWIIG